MEMHCQMQKLGVLALLFHMSTFLHLHFDEKLPLL